MTEPMSPHPDPEDPVDLARDEAIRVSGQVGRNQSVPGVVAVGALALGLMIWLLSGRTPPEPQPLSVDETSTTIDEGDSVDRTVDDEPVIEATTPRANHFDQFTRPPTTTDRAAATEATDPPLALPGWRLVVGDGHNVETIDLGNGERRRHRAVGAPLTTDGDRLLMYQNSELFWLTVDGLDFDQAIGSESLTGVPTLQVMFVRPRSADRPVVVEIAGRAERGIWWPNNNTDPQRWLQISLTDGSVRDEISLTDEVFGGPDVVSTLGSGTFQRVDGRWQPLGDLFVTAVSNSSVLGRRCDSPEQCRTVLVDRRTGTEVVPDPRLGDLSDVVLIRESSRPLAITGGGLVDLTGGTTAAIPGFVTDGPVAVEGSTVAGVRELSVAAGTGTLAIVDIDRGRSSTLAVDLVPRWLVILPPG